MQVWYALLSWLPFEWAEPGKMLFFKNALLAVLIIAPLFGLLSTMVINNKMAFFSESLGHGAFTGMVAGSLSGLVDPVWGAVLFSILFAVLVSFVKQRARLSTDTVIGSLSSISIALGIFLSTLGGGNFSKLNNLLIGDILSITPGQILLLFFVLLFTLGYWVIGTNRLITISLNRSIAISRGLSPFWNETLFSVVIAVVVTISISWVGLLVINSMLILPAAIARNVAKNMRSYTLISVAVAGITGILGLIVSYYLGSSSSSCIVLLQSVLFLFSLMLARRMA